MNKMFLILNPVAGNSDPEEVRRYLDEQIQDAGDPAWQYEIYETTGREDLPSIVRGALDRGANMVVAGGGDGTVSGVASGLAGMPDPDGAPMAILPLGTGNAMARALGLPLDAQPALDLALGRHRQRRIDVMRLGDRFFLANVTVGLSARIMEEADREEKQRFGLLAYVAVALMALLDSPAKERRNRHFALTVDGDSLDVDASEILVLNTGVLGLPKVDLGLDVCPDDGQIDLYAVPAETLVDSLLQAWHLVAGSDEEVSGIRHLTVQHSLSIRSDGPVPFQADGEPLGEMPASDAIEIEVIPAALPVVVPADEPSP
jgi:diacylglycerol kinase family enzyme